MPVPLTMHSITGSASKAAVLVAALVLAVSLFRVDTVVSNTRALYGDGKGYIDVGWALASGQGYSEPHGLWPGRPTIMRAPLWPLVASVPLRVCPQCSLVGAARFSGAVMNATAAFGIAMLTWMLCGSLPRMLLAGLLTAMLPESQPYLMAGMSEPCSGAVVAMGTLLLCLGGRYFFGGVLVLSLLPLVRPYSLILPVSIVAIAFVLRLRRNHSFAIFESRRRLLAAFILFYVPTAGWMIRNYRITGAFPVMTGLEGVSFYGGYNVVTASMGPDFGGWIHPDHIPGQESRYSLSRRMSEIETLRYYRARGRQFILEHWRRLPMLFVARVVRVMLPNPLGGPNKYLYWLVRWALFGAAIVALRGKPPALDNWYGMMLAGLALMTIATVVLYFGEDRYLYQLTILMLALVCSATYLRSGLPADARVGTRSAVSALPALNAE